MLRPSPFAARAFCPAKPWRPKLDATDKSDLSIYPSIYLSIYPSIYLSIYLWEVDDAIDKLEKKLHNEGKMVALRRLPATERGRLRFCRMRCILLMAIL